MHTNAAVVGENGSTDQEAMEGEGGGGGGVGPGRGENNDQWSQEIQTGSDPKNARQVHHKM